MHSFKKYILLILLGLTALAGVLYFIFIERNAPTASKEKYCEQVQGKISSELRDLRENSTRLGLLIQQNPAEKLDFNLFQEGATKPCYIYQNQELIYWSDHRYVPAYEEISSEYDIKLIESNNRKCVVHKLELVQNGIRYEIFSLTPIYKAYQKENEYLKTGYDEFIFHAPPETLKAKPSNLIYENITDDNGKFIFSITPPAFENLQYSSLPFGTLKIVCVFFLILGLWLIGFVAQLMKRKQVLLSFLFIILYLLLLRGFMVWNNIPAIFQEFDLFNPKYFGINSINPTLGDLILNLTSICLLLLFLSVNYFRSRFYYYILKAGSIWQSILSVFFVLLSIGISYVCHEALTYVYIYSDFSLDFSLSVGYSQLKIAVLFYYILLSVFFFLSIHIVANIFYRINKVKKTGFFHWLYGVLLGCALLLFFGKLSWFFILAPLYFLIIYIADLLKFLYNFKYKTSIYFFIGSFFFALITLEVIRKQENTKELFNKVNFGNKYLAENDFLGEGLMQKMVLDIQKDSSVIQAIQRDRLAYAQTSQIIKSRHIDLYFDKYLVTVHSFNEEGENLDPSNAPLSKAFFQTNFQKESYFTSDSNIFFIDQINEDFIHKYLVFIEIPSTQRDIVIEMALKDENLTNVYPELLAEKKLVSSPEKKNYSYAIFSQENNILYSSGTFNYDALKEAEIQPKSLLDKVVRFSEFSHTAVKGNKGKVIVVSSKNTYWKKLLSDFSFLFLIGVVFISLVIVFYGIRYGLKRLNMNLSTKIQLYLNTAFLLPLILVIIITLSVLRSTLMRVQEKFYLENTRNTTSTVQLHLENFKKAGMSRAFFEQEINELARETNSDINYFTPDGKLDFSTRPLVYDYNILSRFINPVAYQKIIENHGSDLLLNESIGDLNYRTAYVNIRDRNNGSLGIVSIPFFDSKSVLDDQISEVVNTILSVFILLFLILLLISHFASSQLTNPLLFITRKLRKTNLDKLNEPLVWESDDEIGVLTRSYNKMLLKLEESKNALSQSEKQTAWREMAKQVAHEIKNPLTPMKLSIQQLQRTLPSIDPESRKRIERALNSLTEQIDTISEITNSFSEFAKMPVPRSEIFDLSEIVKKTAFIYAQNNNTEITLESPEEAINVKSDRQLINRVVTNLIINGIQSVPPGRLPKIGVKVYRNEEEKYAVIEVKDNGSGIPEDVRKKVFIPNFSTKVGGSGLGLAMAKRGIEHSGGNIWFETEEGNGTTFYVDLPLVS